MDTNESNFKMEKTLLSELKEIEKITQGKSDIPKELYLYLSSKHKYNLSSESTETTDDD